MMNRRTLLKGGLAASGMWMPWGRRLTSSGFAAPLMDDDCGVASGDPRPNGVILWTRIPAAARQGLSEAEALPVRYEMATEPQFAAKSIVLSGETTTSDQRDYTVRVQVEGLEAFTTYYYRFLVGSDYVSVTGRTKTAPAPGSQPPMIKFAFVSCQKFTDGYYSAYAHLAREDIDFCLHLGDHIYEQEKGRHGQGDPLDGHVAQTLADYRAKWRHYLSDPHYREVRRQFAWIDLWDDHEVFNDYVGSRDRRQDAPRIAAAYQAFDEYIPHAGSLILSPDGIPSLQMYRSFVFGDLIELFVTDQRQYRTEVPCQGPYAAHQCPQAWSPEHTMLGAAQKAWFKESLGASRARWKIHASEVMVSPLRILSYVKGVAEKTAQTVAQTLLGSNLAQDRGLYLTLDQWDGYPGERDELFHFLHEARIDNYVVVTGDIHSAFHSELQLDTMNNRGPVVGVELVTTAVSSETNGRMLGALAPAADWLIRHSNPNLQWTDITQNGYAVLEVSPAGLQVRHMAVRTVWNPGSPAFVAKEATLIAGRPGFAPV